MNVLPNQQNKGITAAPENLVSQLWNRMGWHASTPAEVWADLSTRATENQCSDMLDDMTDSGVSNDAPLADFLALHLRPSGPIWVIYEDHTDSPATGDAV